MAEGFESVNWFSVRSSRFAFDAQTKPGCAFGHGIEMQIDQIGHRAAKVGEKLVADLSAGQNAAGDNGQMGTGSYPRRLMNSSRKFCVQFIPPISQLSVVTYFRVFPKYGLALFSSGVSSLSQ